MCARQLENIVSEAGVSNDQADLIRKQLAELTIEAAPVASTSTAPPPPPPQPVSTDPSALNPSVASLLQTLNPSLLSNSTAFLAPPAQQRDPAELKYESKLFHRYDRDHRSVGLTAANINR